jgi:hypothetical protein
MWLPLGEGVKLLEEDEFFKLWEVGGIQISEYDGYINIRKSGVGNPFCKIPIEICTLEIVQKLLEEINELQNQPLPN